MSEVLSLGTLVVQTLLMAVEYDVGVPGLDVLYEEYRLGQFEKVGDLTAVGQFVGYLDYRLLPHAIDDEVGTGIAEDTRAETILPVVVMSHASQRGLYAAEDDRDVRIQMFQNLRIDDGGIFRTQVVAAVRRVGVFRAQALGGGVFVDHRVHTTGRNAEEQPRLPQLLEVAEVAVPVGLWDNGDAVAGSLEGAADDGSTERGVVNIGIAGKQDDVHLIPSPQFQFLFGRWQEVCQLIFQSFSVN